LDENRKLAWYWLSYGQTRRTRRHLMQALRIVTDVVGDSITIANLRQFKGRRVEVIIMPLDDELESIRTTSLEGLARAFGDDEPDYSASEVREGNPDYDAR
jgi:hypothetical protein